MKKFAVLAVAAIFTLGLTSCKKDYTCKCTTTSAGISASTSITINDTKKKAKDACDALNTSANVGGISSTTSCSID